MPTDDRDVATGSSSPDGSDAVAQLQEFMRADQEAVEDFVRLIIALRAAAAAAGPAPREAIWRRVTERTGAPG